MLGQHRSTQRKVPCGRANEEAPTADIIALASQYGRYGYRRITALLRDAGWVVNLKRVERQAMSPPSVRGRWRAAAGGAEGPAETTDEKPPLAGRRVVRPSATRAT